MIAEQERSGQPIRRFCEQAKVGEPSFYAWRARLRGETKVEFALVEPRTPGRLGASETDVRLSTGEELRIPAGADAASLRGGVWIGVAFRAMRARRISAFV
jgi:hypothetical protein